jgi:hypothetical protein
VTRKETAACWYHQPTHDSARTAGAVVDASRETWPVVEEVASLKRRVPAKVLERR